jgi:mitogen-activated protein kinase 1/3
MEANLKSQYTKDQFLKDWEICLKDFKIDISHGFLGAGAYGQVVEATHRTTGRHVAIKRISNLFSDVIDTKRILREISLLRFMKNQFVVELLDIIYDESNSNFNIIYLIFEYHPSDLKKVIKSALNLNLSDVMILVYHILCGLKYIHSCGVIHRDLKPGNILIDDNYAIKICDFGLARSVCNPEEEEHLQQDVMDVDDSIESNIVMETEESKSVVPEKKHSRLLKRNNSAKESNTDEMDVESNEQSKDKKTISGRPFLGAIKKTKQILSHHVVTRWYRAPELILVEEYTGAIDIWSVGCVFAELMSMMKENVKIHTQRKPLFPGNRCYPLSPVNANGIKLNKKGFPVDKSDQLNMIFDVIGTPNDEDLGFISNNKALEYIKSLEIRPKKNLKSIFPGSSDEALDLLGKLLHFNPTKRLNVDEAIQHVFFDGIRNVDKEVVADFNLDFSFEKDENLDFEKIRFHLVQFIKTYKIKNCEI